LFSIFHAISSGYEFEFALPLPRQRPISGNQPGRLLNPAMQDGHPALEVAAVFGVVYLALN
jgi:hypothetical protein